MRFKLIGRKFIRRPWGSRAVAAGSAFRRRAEARTYEQKTERNYYDKRFTRASWSLTDKNYSFIAARKVNSLVNETFFKLQTAERYSSLYEHFFVFIFALKSGTFIVSNDACIIWQFALHFQEIN